MGVERHIYPDPAATAEACADDILILLTDAIAKGGRATLAVSGGSTPELMFEVMARRAFPWDRVHLFWVDERAVPPDDPRSNYGMARKSLIEPTGIPEKNVHRIQGELEPAEAARRYEEEIRRYFGLKDGDIPKFDVVHRGMGADAHTASLFPGEPMIQDRSGIAAAVFAATPNMWRVTLLPAVLIAANSTLMLVAGADKAEALRSVLREPYDPMHYPAQISSREGGKVVWFLDEAAAALIQR